MKKKHSKKAFTMVEMVVVICIASLLGVIVLNIFIQGRRTQPKVAANLQMQSTIVTGMNKMLRIIREGIHFIVPRLDEDSSVLLLMDNKKNFRLIFAIEDEEYSEHYKRKLFKLVEYSAETKPINIVHPTHDPSKLKLICRNVVDVSFRLSCANSATAKVRFANESQEFEILSEASLMNEEEDS